MTAADRKDVWTDAVFEAVATLRYDMTHKGTDEARKAAIEIIRLECNRLRHGRDIAGTLPGENDFPGAAAVPAARVFPGSADVSSTRLPQASDFHENRELSDPGSQSGRDVRTSRDDRPDLLGDIDLDTLADAVDPEVLAALEAGEYESLGLDADGIPDPAVWGEEANTDPIGLVQGILTGQRKPPSTRRAGDARPVGWVKPALRRRPTGGELASTGEPAPTGGSAPQSRLDPPYGTPARGEGNPKPPLDPRICEALGLTADRLPDPAIWGGGSAHQPAGHSRRPGRPATADAATGGGLSR